MLIEGFSWIATGAIPLSFAVLMIDRFVWGKTPLR